MIGRVYKIIHNQSDICYIGSTFNELRIRWKQHRDRFSVFKKHQNRVMSIHKYFNEHGLDNFRIILIKEYDVSDRKQLEAFEQLWMNRLKCINEQSAFNPLRQHKQTKKIYRDANKSTIAEQKATKMTCECGGRWTKGHGFKRHEQTKKHQRFINV